MPDIINEVFRIANLKHTAGEIKADLSVNESSPVLVGHFPGQPVVPGACMVQLIKAVLEGVLACPILLKKAGNIKFINMITPGSNILPNLSISYKIVEDELIVTAQIITGDVTCFKMQAVYTRI